MDSMKRPYTPPYSVIIGVVLSESASPALIDTLMKTLRTVLCLCAVGVMCLYSFYLCYNVSTSNNTNKRISHRKRIHVRTKKYPTYYDDDRQRSEWPFAISRIYNTSDLYLWNEIAKSKHYNHQGAGEDGSGFVPPPELKQLMEKLHKEHNYNLLASDMISLHRTLPDARVDGCKILSYPEKLPRASIVIIFHNEAWTTLLRTIWSAIDRAPIELIEEIILVDDLSTWPVLKRPLDDYIELLAVHIRIVRTRKREGLIRARLIGAQNAKGSVLIFLDAHVECSRDWLQPLLSRIAGDRSVVSVPVIDGISSDDMSYKFNRDTYINGFSWTLGFTWIAIPKRERLRTHNDKAATIRTPTLVGCAFAIDREFFFEIGAYDAEMNIWGAENIEMSLRVWQCGGSMEIVPCSRIGHLYRQSVYSFGGDKFAVIAKNNVRVVEVWMSDLKELYYAVTPGHRNVSTGDLRERFELKNRLKCKNFRWFLEKVYPESNMMLDFFRFGEIKSVTEKKCADIHYGSDNSTVVLYDCHGNGGNQMFAFAKNLMIATQNSEQCVGASKILDAVIVEKCANHVSQHWKYDEENKWMIHVATGYCMKANKTDVILRQCDSFDENFKWEINSIL